MKRRRKLAASRWATGEQLVTGRTRRTLCRTHTSDVLIAQQSRDAYSH